MGNANPKVDTTYAVYYTCDPFYQSKLDILSHIVSHSCNFCLYRLNLLRWNDVARKFLVQNCNIFSALSIFKCKGETNAKFITSDEFQGKRERRVTVYGSVARYGPRTSCQRKGLNLLLMLQYVRNIYNYMICAIILNVIQAKQMIRLLLLNNFCPVMSYRLEEK